ncbi:MAG TPA: ribosome rescue GTPase HflX [Pseudomonadales bacterium]|nr:ribosome rescue GTPase HflX [Pseudomonadales bacterium]
MFFDRPQSGERALLVHLVFHHRTLEEDSSEFELLAQSAGVNKALDLTVTINDPSPKFFIGSGKVDEIAQYVQEYAIELVLFNCALTPTQERNLESALKCRVVDRTTLILDIFAQRARTAEGKLQVELAQLKHVSTRLVRGWTHLQKQKGGIGLRGPGETQLETDRRLIRQRMKSLQLRLERVRSQRQQSRKAREKAEIPTIALVGYTNAGKSTLFNWLTAADAYTENLLFATLDPTLRKLILPAFGPVVFVDTVGFIRNLPHQLVDAFRATLEETEKADLLLHVVDLASQHREEDMAEVEAVLSELDVSEIPRLLVYNKIDLLRGEPRIDYDESGKPWRVWVSAREQSGKDELFKAIPTLLSQDRLVGQIVLQASMGQLRALLYQHNAVLHEQVLPEGQTVLQINIARKDWRQFLSKTQLTEAQVGL